MGADKKKDEAEDAGETEKDSHSKKKSSHATTEKKSNLGDTATIKRILDDAAIAVLLHDENHQFVEDTYISNLKLIIGFSGVGAALVSHVYPAPFPRNWMCLLLCCSFYFAMSGILQLLLSFVEFESMIILRGNNACKEAGFASLNVSSHFPRFQEVYTLGFTPVPSGSVLPLARSPRFRPDLDGGNPEPYCMQRSWSIENYFDEEGSFAEAEFMAAVRSFVADYVAVLKRGGSKKTQ